MFVNKWYSIQLRPDSVDRIWRTDYNDGGDGGTPDSGTNGGGGGNPKDPVVGDDKPASVEYINNIQSSEYIFAYETSAGTNVDGLENLDVGFTWTVIPNQSYLNCLNAKANTVFRIFASKPYTHTAFELRKIKPGYENTPFDPNGYVRIATGKRTFPYQINDYNSSKYYVKNEHIGLRQNLVWRGLDKSVERGEMSFVDKYNGPERRFLVGKISNFDYDNGIIEFSLDESEFYDKSKKVFKFDGLEWDKKEFIDTYLRKRLWTQNITIGNDGNTYLSKGNWKSIEWFSEYKNTSNDGIGYVQYNNNYIVNSNARHFDNPEILTNEDLYDDVNNVLRLYRGDLVDEIKTYPNLGIGDVIKIDIEPRLLEDTYYYLTLNTDTYTHDVDREYWKIDDTAKSEPLKYSNLSGDTANTCTVTIIEKRPESFNDIAHSSNFQKNQGEFYNDFFKYTLNDFNLPTNGFTGNHYFAWFKTPTKWIPYKAPTPEPPKPTEFHRSPTIKFGYSYEKYTSSTKPDDKGTVNGEPTDTYTYKVTLKGRFWFDKLDYKKDGSLAFPGDLPISVGFLIKKSGDTQFKYVDGYRLDIFDKSKKLVSTTTDIKASPIPYITNLETSEYTRDLPDDKGGASADRQINFSTSFFVGANINWQYRIFVKCADGNLYYADPDLWRDSISVNFFSTTTEFLIKTAGITLNEFIPPVAKDTGFWYQIYNSWKEVTTATGRILPYLTVRIFDGVGFPTNETNRVDKDYPIHYYLNYVFNSDKNFQFRTIVENYYNTSGNIEKPDIKFKTPWGEEINMPTPFIGLSEVPDVLKRINIYSYSNINGYNNNTTDVHEPDKIKPKKLISSKTNPQNPITYVASPYFGAQDSIMESGLCHVGVSENDWTIQGSAVWNVMTQTTNGQVNPDGTIEVPYFYGGKPYAGRGWHYLPKDDKFIWFDSLYDINKCFPMGGDPNDYFSGKESNIGYMPNNFISTYIPYQLFNLSFEYTNDSPSKITMYMGGELPYKNPNNFKTTIDDLIEKGKVKKIGILGTSTGKKQKCDFIGLVGNQYLFFVAEPILDFNKSNNFTNYGGAIIEPGPIMGGKYYLSSDKIGIGTYSVIEISNFGISGTYNKANNLLHQTKQIGSYTTGITNAAYSIKLGVGNNVFSDSINSTVIVSTKSGNGTMHSGIWENGVWNSGWRSDTTTRDFRSVGQYYSYDKDRTWRMSINGRKSSVNYFKVGDVVAISNVVAIDINEERKLLKSNFRIITKTFDSIVVEFDTDFPIRRIEKDSSEHRILVTKNVWLNGVFLNGYFKGVWNNGLFSGFPMITKMDSSHWIDGIFNGGHFTAKKLRITSSGNNIAKSYKVDDKERMAISFTNDHSIEKDDVISMTYSTDIINNGVLGSTIVLDVPDSKTVVTGIGWRNELKEIKSITFITSISDGLVQNFEFHANNVSTVTSLDTLLSERVFSYNSWMDINYSSKSAINIGRPQTLLNEHDKAYSENNLYGYPTNDILSSKSTFRDSYSRTVRNYKLGKKYKIYKDYVGESSGFENYFDPTDTTQGDETFKEQGWNWSKSQETIRTITAASAEKSTEGKLSLKIPIENPYVMSLTGSVTITGPVEIWPVANNGLGNQIVSYGIMSVSTTIDNVTKDSTQYTVNTSNDMFLTPGSTPITGPSWATTGGFGPDQINDPKFYISTTQSGSIKFSRTPEPSGQGIPGQGKELLVTALGSGGILYLKENKNVEDGNEYVDPVPKQRYTMVEFNLINYKGSADGKGEYTDDIGTLPPIHFNNVNRVFRKTSNGVVNLSATYLPIYKNVNHVATFGEKKQEFFFNKRNILMSFTGYGSLGSRYSEYMIDNLKLYEVDMVPFFQYFKNPFGKTGNINTSVQIPNTGESPGLIESSDKVIDATTENEVVNKFVSEFVSFNTQIPNAVNWRRDYAIYGPQMSDSYTDPRLY